MCPQLNRSLELFIALTAREVSDIFMHELFVDVHLRLTDEEPTACEAFKLFIVRQLVLSQETFHPEHFRAVIALESSLRLVSTSHVLRD